MLSLASHGDYADDGTGRLTDGRTPDRYTALSAMDAASVISWYYTANQNKSQLSQTNIAPFCVTARVLSPVHTSNIVEATFDFVVAKFDFVATNGNNVERVYRKISSFGQSRNKFNMFNLFRLCRKEEISFDIVAKNGKTATMSKQHSTWTLSVVNS